jgi:hypothetical protein
MTSPNPDPDPAGGAARQPRAATWPGRPAARPTGAYDPAPPVHDGPAAGAVEVHFTGEDGRTDTFSFAALPLPGWHADLAVAFARLTGPTGGLRTLAGTRTAWAVLARLVRFLDGLARPPRDVAELTARHLRRFELHRQQTCNPHSVTSDLRVVRRLLEAIVPRERLRPDVLEWSGHRWREHRPAVAGYSEGEFHRIIAAARNDVAAIRDRIGAKCFLGVHAAWLSSSSAMGCWSGANGPPICDSTWAGVIVWAHRSASASRSWRS